MPLASGKDEMGIVAMLHVSAQDSFHIVFRIICDLLEFVDGYDAGLVRLFQIMEYFIQRSVRRLDVSQA